jgi:hypothetical protein
MQSTIKYTIPFYTRNKILCYINPLKPIGIELVFWNARKMDKHLAHFDFKKRKRFGGITFRTLEEVDFELLDGILREAIELDEVTKS